MNVVIVDDEPKIREGLKAMVPKLCNRWHVVGAFSDSQEALAFLSGHPTDVLLLDIQMPGLDGFSLLEQLVGRDMLVIIVSGFAHFEYAQRAISLGVFNYLLKPVNPNKLRVVMEHAEVLTGERQIESRGLNELREKLIADAVLFTADEDSLSARAAQLGLFSGRYRLACVTIETMPPQSNAALQQTLTRTARVERGGYAVCIGEGRFAVLVSEPDEPGAVQRLSDRLCAEVARALPATQFMVGVSSEYRQLSQAPRAWREALAARILCTDGVTFEYQDIVDRAGSYSSHVKRTLEFILGHCEQPLRLEDISEAVYLHANYISDLFRRETGVALSAFIMGYKVYRAKKLLLDVGNKIYGVAEAVGFKDQRYFSQVFKKYTGMTPAEYRHHEGRPGKASIP